LSDWVFTTENTESTEKELAIGTSSLCFDLSGSEIPFSGKGVTALSISAAGELFPAIGPNFLKIYREMLDKVNAGR